MYKKINGGEEKEEIKEEKEEIKEEKEEIKEEKEEIKEVCHIVQFHSFALLIQRISDFDSFSFSLYYLKF